MSLPRILTGLWLTSLVVAQSTTPQGATQTIYFPTFGCGCGELNPNGWAINEQRSVGSTAEPAPNPANNGEWVREPLLGYDYKKEVKLEVEPSSVHGFALAAERAGSTGLRKSNGTTLIPSCRSGLLTNSNPVNTPIPRLGATASLKAQ